jgi:hypothetical protein
MGQPYHYSTATGAPAVTAIKSGQSADISAVSATNNQTAPYFIHLAWQGNSNTAPVAGTATVGLTISVPVGGTNVVFYDQVQQAGPLYYWVSAKPADTDTTALSTAGDVFTFVVD